jgi:hypothetical protein
MTIFRFHRVEIACFLSPSRASISEMCQKCGLFQAFPGAFPIYFGEQAVSADRGEKWRMEKDALTMLRHIT